MRRLILGQLGAVLLIGLAVSTAGAQTPPASPAPQPGEPSVAGRFLRDVGGDYKHFFSQDTALLLGLGGGAALAIHPADESIATSAEQANVTLKGGATYGSQLFQVPVAVAWWIAGSAAGQRAQRRGGPGSAARAARGLQLDVRDQVRDRPHPAERRSAIVPVGPRGVVVRDGDGAAGALRVEARPARVRHGELHRDVARHGQLPLDE